MVHVRSVAHRRWGVLALCLRGQRVARLIVVWEPVRSALGGTAIGGVARNAGARLTCRAGPPRAGRRVVVAGWRLRWLPVVSTAALAAAVVRRRWHLARAVVIRRRVTARGSVTILRCALVVRDRACTRNRRVAGVSRALVRSWARVHVPWYAKAVVRVAECRRRDRERGWCRTPRHVTIMRPDGWLLARWGWLRLLLLLLVLRWWWWRRWVLVARH